MAMMNSMTERTCTAVHNKQIAPSTYSAYMRYLEKENGEKKREKEMGVRIEWEKKGEGGR